MRAAITWVDVLLSQWGRWSIKRSSGALGFASSSLLCAAGAGDGYDSAVPRGVCDDDLLDVDAAVNRLPVYPYASAVIAVYVFGAGKSDEENARRVDVSRRTLEKYIQKAQCMIAIDILDRGRNNSPHSVIGGTTPETIQPVTAQA